MDNTAFNRLRWMCRRGLLELDLVLERFLQNQAANLSDADCAGLGELLRTEDNDLWDILNGRSDDFDPHHRALVELLRSA
ncbi:MAG: succinate dehydrogenase assembly factor 2 [Betaproteobacteria bacterium]|nr:succinate dehydrogenase assembly factor 2 [Betaproteobacteria bacterium]